MRELCCGRHFTRASFELQTNESLEDYQSFPTHFLREIRQKKRSFGDLNPESLFALFSMGKDGRASEAAGGRIVAIGGCSSGVSGESASDFSNGICK